MKNKGFTLIEMLAVVLIIAMLVSVALPKYKRSVVRAEAMEALTNLRTLQDAALRAKAANTQRAAPLSLNELDIDLFDASNKNSSTFIFGRYRYIMTSTFIRVQKRTNANYAFIAYYPDLNGMGGEITCTGDTNTLWLCESMCREDSAGNCVKKQGQYIIN